MKSFCFSKFKFIIISGFLLFFSCFLCPLYSQGTGKTEGTAGKNETLQLAADVTLELTAVPDTVTKAETKVEYIYTVTNTGSDTVRGITITDDRFEEISVSPDTLLPGKSLSVFYEFIVTQEHIDEGIDLVNTASVSTAEGEAYNADVTVDIIQSPSVIIEINADKQVVSSVGDPINYTFKVTNNGNVTLSNISVEDSKPGTISMNTNTLQPGSSSEGNKIYETTQDDFDSDNGIENIAEVTTAEEVTDSDTVTVAVSQNISVTIEKTADKSSVSKKNEVITYTYKVTNDGNVTLNSISVSDDMLGPVTLNATSLAPGLSAEGKDTYTVDQSDMDSGNDIVNIAKVTTAEEATDSATAAVRINQQPDLSITKTAAETSYSSEGDTINYTIEVENKGNTTISSLNIFDPLTGLDQDLTDFDPGTKRSFQTSYEVDQDDLDAGSVTNTVTASDGGSLNASAGAKVNAILTPDLEVIKTASPSTYEEVGDEISYSIIVRNSGNTTLENITVTDPLVDLNTAIASLAPGKEVPFNETYIIDQDDLDAGSVINTVTASGGGDLNATAADTVFAALTPGISLVKTASPTTFSAVGDDINYTIEVTNTGNVVLTDVVVSDQLLGIEESIAELASGATGSYQESYKITQIDLNNGTLSNTAFVTSKAPNGDVIKDSDTFSVTADQNPEIFVNKTASPVTYSSVGDEITYSITVENTGNVVLTDIIVSDPLIGMKESVAVLSPGESELFTQSYPINQDHLNAGSITNTVTVSGNSPDDTEVSDTDDVTVTAVQEPALFIDKTASPLTFKAVGDRISYSIFVENTGNVALSDVTVSDPLIQFDVAIGNLNPGDSRSYSSDYSVVQSDLNTGEVVNTATVVGTNGNETVDALAEVVVTAIFPPAAANDINSDNISGNSVVTDILANDLLNDGSPALPGLVTVDLNQQAGGVQSQLIVQGEGTWSYNPQNGELTFTPQSGFTTDPSPISYLLTEKSTGLSDAATVTVEYNEGEPFAFNDISTGNVPGDSVNINILSNDKLSDGSPVTIQLVTVDIDVTQSGVQNEYSVPDEGSWVFTPETGEVVFTPSPGYSTDPAPLIYLLTENLTGLSDSGTVVVGYDEQPPVAADDNSSGHAPGDEVSVNILENDALGDGTQALPDLVAVDLNLDRAGVQNELEVSGEGLWSFDASTGIVSFNPEPGFAGTAEPVLYRLTEILTGLDDEAAVTIIYDEQAPVAADDSSSNNQPGNEVSINILENDILSDGSPALPDLVTVDIDPQTAGVQNEYKAEDEGTWTFNPLTGTLTFAPDPDFFSDPAPLSYRLCSIWDSQLCSEAEVVIDFEQDASLASIGLIKKGTYVPEEDVINYSFEVRNTGSLTVWNIAVVDERIGLNNLLIVPDTLPPGASGTATATYQVTQEDRNTGNVTNSALAEAFIENGERIEDISGGTVEDDEPTVTPLLQNTSIVITKQALNAGVETVLYQTVDFLLTVKNQGNVVLDNVRVEDPLTGFEQDVGQLFPDDSVVYNTMYTVQPEDELNGEFKNTAIVSAVAPDGTPLIDSSIVVVDVEQCEMVIPTGFSPNDDGIQDVWRIKCLEKYPNARVEVFNRWGNRVFEKDNFGNTDVHGVADAWWDGYSTSLRDFGSGRLPAGTYYYILYLQDGQEPLSGHVFLNR